MTWGNAGDSREVRPKGGAIRLRLAEGCSRVARSHAGFPQRFVSNTSLRCIRAATPLSLHLRGAVVGCPKARRWPRQVHGRCLAALVPWDLPYCCVLNDMVRILNPSAPQLTIRSRYKCFSSVGFEYSHMGIS